MCVYVHMCAGRLSTTRKHRTKGAQHRLPHRTKGAQQRTWEGELHRVGGVRASSDVTMYACMLFRCVGGP